MKKFVFSVEICLGYHCCGCPEYAEGEGSVELEDSQVDKLVSLIRESGGETDPDILCLQEKYPDIYDILEEAYSDAAHEAEYRHHVISGYENGYFEQPSGLMETLERDGLYTYVTEDGEEDVDEYDKQEAFCEWIGSYIDTLGEEDLVDFLEKYFVSSLEDIETGFAEYEVGIPKGIIELATEGNA